MIKVFSSFIRSSLNMVGLELVKIEQLKRDKREMHEHTHRVTKEMAGKLVEKDAEILRLKDKFARQEAVVASVRSGVGTMTFRSHEAAKIAKEVEQKTLPRPVAPADTVSGLRSFDVQQRDEIVSAFREQEAVLVRNAISKDWVERNLPGLKRHMDCIKATNSDESTPDIVKNLTDTFSKQSGANLATVNDEFFSEPATIRNALTPLKASGIIDCARHFFGSELFFMPDYSSARRQSPAESERALGWHQDGASIGNVSGKEQGLVFWVPLTPLDDSTPGLEVALKKTSTLKPHIPTDTNYNEIENPDEMLKDCQKVLAQVPPMKVGDILVFSFNTIHRTLVKPGMTKTRYSLDLRAVPLTGVPWEYKGWLVIP